MYDLTPEQIEFRDAIRQIVRERVAPRAAQNDAQAEYPWDVRRLFAEHDLLGLPFETEHGGTGNAKITQIYEGTNEIQRVVIARAMR